MRCSQVLFLSCLAFPAAEAGFQKRINKFLEADDVVPQHQVDGVDMHIQKMDVKHHASKAGAHAHMKKMDSSKATEAHVSKAIVNATPCEPGSAGCKSMCRWLKMTDRSTGNKCLLFERQLKSCEYVPPDDRVNPTDADPMDCAVTLMRTYSLQSEVPEYISAIDECVSGLPPRVNATCHVALDLLRSEMTDWKREAILKADAGELRTELRQASTDAQQALNTKTNVDEMIEKLTQLLARAEELPGHYLVEDVHLARRYLDQLAPIPAVREQLVQALEHGKLAFATVNLFRVKEAIAWLHVAVQKAKKFEVGPPTEEGGQTLRNLIVLKGALVDLNTAIFAGNVSVNTKSSVPEAMQTLASAMQRCRDAGLTNEMREARGLLFQLQELNLAVVAEKNATAIGTDILQTAGNKGYENLKRSAEALNASVIHAMSLGLGDNASTAAAVATFDKIQYTRHARAALQDAVANAKDVLSNNGSMLSDDAEESARSFVLPAIAWGEEVGLVNGLEVAKQLADNLKAVETAKETMIAALAQGNASLTEKAEIVKAINMLQGAIAGDNKVNINAGVATAKRLIKNLRALLSARQALVTATEAAKEALRSQSGFAEAMDGMNTSLKNAAVVGLDTEVEVGTAELQALTEYVAAAQKVQRAFAQEAPMRGPATPAEIEDPQPYTVFNRTGLKVEDLPTVAAGEDDGDEDFDEHIAALEAGIARAKKKGLVDPDMQAQLQTIIAQKAAYWSLQNATEIGQRAFDSKRGIATAITKLTSALEEATEMGIELGVSKAQALHKDLSVIQPARDEMQAAILQANVSVHAVSGMDAALVRLNRAIEVNEQLDLVGDLEKARNLAERLLQVKKAFVTLRAAVMQGEIALQNEQGEEAAITELNKAIEAADEINLHKSMPIAVDLLHQLMHMNAEKQQVQAAMNPIRR